MLLKTSKRLAMTMTLPSWTKVWGGNLFFLDCETQCELDVTKVGAPAYARALRERAEKGENPVMCWAWWNGGGDITLWTPENDVSLDPLLHHDGMYVAHNVEFESNVIRELYGLDIPPERWWDTAALARHWSYPGSLKHATGEKDMEGNRIMLKLSKPGRPSKDNRDLFWTPRTKPEDFERLYEYCRQDVIVMARFMKTRLLPPRANEKKVMDLTMAMNRRGMPIDIPSLGRAKLLANRDQKRISDEVKKITGFTATQVGELAKWLGMKSIAKDKLRDALRDPSVSEKHKEVLRLRQEFAKASVNKLNAFLARAVDGRIHDGLIYGGAERSLRWSGAGLQPQNIPRGGGFSSLPLFDAIAKGELPAEYTDDDGNRITGTQDIIKSMLRGFITGPLLVGDYSQIEARTLAWYADDGVMLDAFATGKDPYKLMASSIYRKPVEEITKPERFMGKQTVLGCGYGLGPGGFQSMLDITYDVQIDESTARSIVSAYRNASPKVVSFWSRIEQKLIKSRKDHKARWIVPGLLAVHWYQPDEFFIQLPSGRRITYRGVEGDTYYGRMKGGGYGQVKFYGGALTGHIVQGTARDLMAYALLNLDAAGFHLILTVHDEAVALAMANRLKEFERTLRLLPDWAKGLPVDVECVATPRYRK